MGFLSLPYLLIIVIKITNPLYFVNLKNIPEYFFNFKIKMNGLDEIWLDGTIYFVYYLIFHDILIPLKIKSFIFFIMILLSIYYYIELYFFIKIKGYLK
jgi:hypothetical protein